MARRRYRQRQKRMVFRGHEHRDIITGGNYHGAICKQDSIEPIWRRYKPRLTIGSYSWDDGYLFLYDIVNQFVTVFKYNDNISDVIEPYTGYSSYVTLVNGCIWFLGVSKDGYTYKYDVDLPEYNPLGTLKFGSTKTIEMVNNLSNRTVEIRLATLDYREGQKSAQVRQIGGVRILNIDSDHVSDSSYCGNCSNPNLSEFVWFRYAIYKDETVQSRQIRTWQQWIQKYDGTNLTQVWYDTFSYDMFDHANMELPIGPTGSLSQPNIHECGDYFVWFRTYYTPSVGGYRISAFVSYRGGSFTEYFIQGLGDYVSHTPVFLLYRNSTAYLYCRYSVNTVKFAWTLYTSSGNFSTWTRVSLPNYLDVNLIDTGIDEGYHGSMGHSEWDFVRIILNNTTSIPDTPSNAVPWYFYPPLSLTYDGRECYVESINGVLTDKVNTTDMCLVADIRSCAFIYIDNLTFQQSSGNYAFAIDPWSGWEEPVAPGDYVYGGAGGNTNSGGNGGINNG